MLAADVAAAVFTAAFTAAALSQPPGDHPDPPSQPPPPQPLPSPLQPPATLPAALAVAFLAAVALLAAALIAAALAAGLPAALPAGSDRCEVLSPVPALVGFRACVAIARRQQTACSDSHAKSLCSQSRVDEPVVNIRPAYHVFHLVRGWRVLCLLLLR